MKKTLIKMGWAALVAITISISTSLSFAGVEPTGGGSSCEAHTFLGLGGSCSVNCGPGQTATCKSGFTSCECSCSGGNVRLKPSLSQNQLNDGASFIAYCASYGTGNMTQLGTKSSQVLYTYQNGTNAEYDAAEEDWNAQLLLLNSTELGAVNSWRDSHGYFN